MNSANLFDAIPGSLPEELETLLAEGRQFRLKRIVSRGHTTDWYDQDEDEWVMLVRGAAELEFDGGSTLRLGAGDYVFIPARKKHRVSWTDAEQNAVWLALYFRADT